MFHPWRWPSVPDVLTVLIFFWSNLINAINTIYLLSLYFYYSFYQSCRKAYNILSQPVSPTWESKKQSLPITDPGSLSILCLPFCMWDSISRKTLHNEVKALQTFAKHFENSYLKSAKQVSSKKRLASTLQRTPTPNPGEGGRALPTVGVWAPGDVTGAVTPSLWAWVSSSAKWKVRVSFCFHCVHWLVTRALLVTLTIVAGVNTDYAHSSVHLRYYLLV